MLLLLMKVLPSQLLSHIAIIDDIDSWVCFAAVIVTAIWVYFIIVLCYKVLMFDHYICDGVIKNNELVVKMWGSPAPAEIGSEVGIRPLGLLTINIFGCWCTNYNHLITFRGTY